MTPTSLLSTSLLAASCALLTASCVLSPESSTETKPDDPQISLGPEPTGEAQQETGRGYQSSDFPFVVDLPDDGQGDAGGWQKADKTFHFVERNWGIPVYFWQCRVQIQMAIRSTWEGRITPSRAALYSAEVANTVVDPLLDSRKTWENQGTAFCEELKKVMNATFRGLHPTAGARVLLNQ